MRSRNLLSKSLASAGTVLVLLPILFMLLTAVMGSIQSGRLLCDYMLPAELALLVLVGIAALIWAGIREHFLLKPLAWTSGAALLLLAGCQIIAVITGLASGRVQMQDAPGLVALVTVMLIGYDLGVTLLGYLGIRLIIHAFTTVQSNQA